MTEPVRLVRGGILKPADLANIAIIMEAISVKTALASSGINEPTPDFAWEDE